jgi:thiol-disulfide isomerase/thioredoxin
MKQIALAFLCCISCFSLLAKDGYRVEVKFKQDIPDTMVYLAHYFGKNLPTIYKLDSAKVVNRRKAVFERKENVLGGIYMIIYSKNSKLIEFVLDNGTNLEILADTSKGKTSSTNLEELQFKNSEENDRYLTYNKLMESLALQNQELSTKLPTLKTHEDTVSVTKKYNALLKEQADFRKNYVKQYPNTLLSNIFNAMRTPEVPEGTHYLADGKTVDSLFPYHYYKTHYWDNFNFQDDRIMHTPIFDSKLNDYFDKWLYPIPDTISHEADMLLKKMKGTKELYKYTLRTLTNKYLQSKIMGMDEVFVHLVEKYYMKGEAYWLDSAGLAWYEDRAKKIAPNVLGNIAPDLNMQDVFTLKDLNLHSVKARYTLVIIWAYDCGTCQKEIPQVDSLYRAALKQKGLKIYSIASGGELAEIQKFIEKNKIREWINVADINNNTGFKQKYDAYSTPKLYLLDENKKIIGKGLDHSNILSVIEWDEKKKKTHP